MNGVRTDVHTVGTSILNQKTALGKGGLQGGSGVVKVSCFGYNRCELH